MKAKYPTVVLIAIGISLMSLTGCEMLSSMFSNQDRADLETALQRLQVESGEWQDILADLENEVSRGLQNDVQNVLTRAIGSAGEQANCLADIRIGQIRLALQNMLAQINGQPVQPIVPVICLVSPDNVRMTYLESPNYERVIKLSGYDMDKGPIQAKLIRDNGAPLDLGQLTVQTHYHANFNFANVQLNIHAVKFAFYHNDQELSAVTIEQTQCEEKTDQEVIGNASVSDFSNDGGDKDFGGNNARFKVDVDLRIVGQEIKADIEASVTEVGGDTRGSKNVTVTVYTNTDPDFNIASIVSDDSFRESSFINNEEADETETYATGGLVRSITYRGRRWGFDDRDHAKLIVVFNPISVKLKEHGACLP